MVEASEQRSSGPESGKKEGRGSAKKNRADFWGLAPKLPKPIVLRQSGFSATPENGALNRGLLSPFPESSVSGMLVALFSEIRTRTKCIPIFFFSSNSAP